ncbi:hypothetical protein [Suicoccus acidiformans]|uniref:hypothetical protein n=1 Tax=Suicoccus acidiformans TaxID=2036206 RepID=UPI0013C35E0D|nr:hypothetical protein [Suicoccus acidiformans]
MMKRILTSLVLISFALPTSTVSAQYSMDIDDATFAVLGNDKLSMPTKLMFSAN